MSQQWYYLDQKGQPQGPLSLEQLLKKVRMSPKTLVRKGADAKWLPAHACPELKIYFEDKKKPFISPSEEPSLEREKRAKDQEAAGDVIVSGEFQPPLGGERWIIILLILLMLLTIWNQLPRSHSP